MNKNMRNCTFCSKRLDKRKMILISQDKYKCLSCKDKKIITLKKCDICNDSYPLVFTINGKNICHECQDKLIIKCDKCRKPIDSDDYPSSCDFCDKIICETCQDILDMHFVECSECESVWCCTGGSYHYSCPSKGSLGNCEGCGT